MNRGQTIALVGIAGIIAYMKWGDTVFESESAGTKSLIERVRSKFSPSDLEQITKERSGMTVDTIPSNFTPSSSQAGHFVFDKTTTYVNDAPFGPGVSDVKMNVQQATLSAESFTSFNAQAPGQELISEPVRQLHSIQPTSRDVCCKPIESYGMNIANLNIGNTLRAGLPEMQGRSNTGMLSPEGNENYTDNSITQSLAQWRDSGMVDVINGSIAIFRPYMGGSETRLRRV